MGCKSVLAHITAIPEIHVEKSMLKESNVSGKSVFEKQVQGPWQSREMKLKIEFIEFSNELFDFRYVFGAHRHLFFYLFG